MANPVTPASVDTVLDGMTLNQVQDQIPAASPEPEFELTNVQVRKIVNWLQKLADNNGYHGVRRRFHDFYGFKVPLWVVQLIDERRQVRIAELTAPVVEPPPGG